MRIEVNNISYSYGKNRAIENIKFEVDDGTMVSIVGPNGSGKSTLIKCLSGVLRIKEGSILISGEKLDKSISRKQAQDIAYVPQDDFEPAMTTVFDFLMLGRRPYIQWHERDEDEDIVIGVIEKLKIGDLCMRYVGDLSGGQRQLVRIGRALCQTPKVILLDEPTSNLDIGNRKEIMLLLEGLVEEGITVITALHDVNLAFDYFDKVIMLKDGRLFREGGKELAQNDVLSELYGTNLNVRNIENQIIVLPNKY